MQLLGTDTTTELRSKLIHLRENYIGIKKPKDLKPLLKSAIPTLMPLLYGLLFIKNIKIPSDLDSLYLNVEKSYDIDMGIFRKVREDTMGKKDLTVLINELINLLERLINIVDKMEF